MSSASAAESDTGRPEGDVGGPQQPAISLPKGGGAIRGIGEKFAANPVTGTGSMSVPIAVSPGRSGFGPQLSLAYDSGSGNGPFGFGWSLSLPRISRKTDKGLPQYRDAEESDVFLLSGAEDLVPVLEADGSRSADTSSVPGTTIHRYRPRIEGLFARIERWTRHSDGDVHWRSISRDNVLTLYGKDAGSRIADPEHPERIFTWLICETRDDKGNAVLYEYAAEDGTGVDLSRAHERNRGERDDPRRSANRYLARIVYGNRVPLLDAAGHRPRSLSAEEIGNAGWMFGMVFDYGEHHPDDDEYQVDAPEPKAGGEWSCRDDPFSTYRAGFEVRTCRLCQRVLMFHHFPEEPDVRDDCLVRSTDFTYSHEEDPENARNPVYTFLRAVTQSGYKHDGDGYLKRSLPPVEFGYTEPVVQETVEEVGAESLENLPAGVDGAVYRWTDLHGEGTPGVLSEQAGAWFYKRNLSPASGEPVSRDPVELAAQELVASKPNLALAGGQAQFMDLAGDGQPDVVVLEGPTPGLYEHDGEEGWQPFRPFISRLRRDTGDPNLRFVDLTGDGHADVLISEEDVFVWHPSLAEEGFGTARRVSQALDEEEGPRLVFAETTQTIHLADLSGDGLSDLVRIKNGEVCYWPNLGHGRFGAKVTMDGAPCFDHPDQFEPRRLRLADIDGSGTTDLIYLHRDGVRLYFNQSGNSWSAPRALRVFPRVDDFVHIVPTDLLGNGTACLVWSSPLPGDRRRPMRYVNLMGGQKPHLLVKTVNNLGAETRVEYAPSTKFYLQDKRDGKPWITRLPFPVHVVERVETWDHVSRNRFVSRYTYHHGTFDGEEREFRGFGMVEQWDSEEFAALTADGTLPEAANVDDTSHVPPVLTRTWFHTGLYAGRDRVSNGFAGLVDEEDRGEYYREPEWRDDDEEARKRLLPDTVLPSGLTAEEERQACRALKGSMLRQEVYALDGSDEAEHPYTVAEQNFSVRRLQPRGGNRHAVFFTHPHEAITYHYERNPADPRIQHALTLAVDPYGNVLKELAVGYGRRAASTDPVLSDDDRAKQAGLLITFTESSFTKKEPVPPPPSTVDHHRTPLPAETRTYELTGFEPEGGAPRFSFDQWVRGGFALLASAAEIPYEQTADGSARQKRLIEHVRTRYRSDDLTALLSLREVGPLALPGESYKLAFTPGLLAGVFVRPLDRVPEPGEPPPESLVPDLADVLAGTGPDGGGYVELEEDGRWWIPSGRIFYASDDVPPAGELAEAREHFFLPRRFRDPFGHDATVRYDPCDLLTEETRDAVDNVVTAGERDTAGDLVARGLDYRVLQPALVTGPNGNRSAVAFDALGMVAGTAVMGKPEPAEPEGDSLAGFEADLTEAQVDGFYAAADPHLPAPDLLAGATTRVVYDLHRFRRTRQEHPEDPEQWLPVYAATLARETHASDPLPPDGLAIQSSFGYSDGFGREIQKKIQGEPEPVADDGPEVSPRWVGSGWTIFNNKGKPVRQYEPFFSATHAFDFAKVEGVSPILFYDPVERVVATLYPDHSWEKVIFDPWRQESWDVNDTVDPTLLDPESDPHVSGFFGRLPATEYSPTWYEQRIGGGLGSEERIAAEKAAVHAGTPTLAFFDTLGRTFLTVAQNRFHRGGDFIEEAYATRVRLDIEGNQREVVDAKDRVVMRYHYDMLGNRVHQASMEAGERWMLNDITGNAIRAWDSRGHQFRTAYDQLRRPTATYLRAGEGPESLVERTVYGESAADPEATNLRGQVLELCDQAGVVTSGAYDFKGHLLRSQRQLAQEYKTVLDWAGEVPLEETVYTSRTRYDALDRPIQLIAPHSDASGANVNVLQPVYNQANFLERMNAWLEQDAEPADLLDPPSADLQAVTGIDYDAKGQRTRIAYGNGAVTTYGYDDLTFRLRRLRTTRPAVANGLASQIFADPSVVQDLRYTYDPSGNITRIADDALPVLHYNGEQIKPVCTYIYDAVYRLIEATGREHIGQSAFQLAPPDGNFRDYPFLGLAASPFDALALRNYTERYAYDGVGNFEKMIHKVADGGWTRAYAYEDASQLESTRMSNRLSSTTVGDTVETYLYAGPAGLHGNMTAMAHLPLMQWDYRDQLQATSRQVVANGGTPETTWYVYDAAGQRVRKVTERQAGAEVTPTRKAGRIYLGGFEIYREYEFDGEAVKLERETLHVMDDQRQLAFIETRTIANGNPVATPVPLQRYQLGNYLDSANLELDEVGALISCEVFHPYGTPAFQAGRSAAEVNLKVYRYTGKERDKESGFNYHFARYYTPWLGRWTSSDPGELIDGVNVYAYLRNSPINHVDREGLLATPGELSRIARRHSDDPTEIIDWIQDQRQLLNIPLNERLSGRHGLPIGGWIHKNQDESVRVDFSQWYSQREGNQMALVRMLGRLANTGTARSVVSQLAALEHSDPHFDPELVLVIANQETRGRGIFRTSGMIAPPSDTFHQGGLDFGGSRLVEMKSYLPRNYAPAWTAVSPYSTTEHKNLVHPLTNIPFTQLIAAYGAYIRSVRESVVFGEGGLSEAERGNVDVNTLRFLTRLAFGAPRAFREVLSTMREIQAGSEEANDLSDVLLSHVGDLLERHRGNVYLERALITVGESSVLEQTRVLRSGNPHGG